MTGYQRWTEIGNWYDTLAAGRTEAPHEIADKSREAGGGADFKAKIQGVASFMQREIRYVGIEIGIGGCSRIRQPTYSSIAMVIVKTRRRC